MDTTQTKTNAKSLLVILILIALVLVTGIFGYKFWREYSIERDRINKQLAILNEKQQQISDLETKLENTQKDMQILLNNKAADQSQELSQIKDAYFLARLAEDRLQYANDIQAAKQLLQLAIDQLSSLNTPAVVKAKSILAADQAKLNALNYPDDKETREKLAVLDGLLDQLPLRPLPGVANKKVATLEKNNTTSSFDKEWQATLNQMIEDLKAVVKIHKKNDGDLDLAYINSEIGKAQFKLLIEQIRWAIFYRDATVFQRSVHNAQVLLGQVYDMNHESVRKFAATLDELAKVQIQPQIPSIQDSVSALQALLVR